MDEEVWFLVDIQATDHIPKTKKTLNRLRSVVPRGYTGYWPQTETKALCWRYSTGHL